MAEEVDWWSIVLSLLAIGISIGSMVLTILAERRTRAIEARRQASEND